MNLLIAAKETENKYELIELMNKALENWRKGLYTITELDFCLDYIVARYSEMTETEAK